MRKCVSGVLTINLITITSKLNLFFCMLSVVCVYGIYQPILMGNQNCPFPLNNRKRNNAHLI